MKYFGYMPNDFINGKGVSVSLWTAGCPHHCPGCHNSEMWNYQDGYDCDNNLIEKLSKAITDNGIIRNFSILGGEPLAEYNKDFVSDIIQNIRKKFPNIKIFLWTGYELERDLLPMSKSDTSIYEILKNIDYLIDGPFIEELKDLTLKLRGSKNQHIYENVLRKENNSDGDVFRYIKRY